MRNSRVEACYRGFLVSVALLNSSKQVHLSLYFHLQTPSQNIFGKQLADLNRKSDSEKKRIAQEMDGTRTALSRRLAETERETNRLMAEYESHLGTMDVKFKCEAERGRGLGLRYVFVGWLLLLCGLLLGMKMSLPR